MLMEAQALCGQAASQPTLKATCNIAYLRLPEALRTLLKKG